MALAPLSASASASALALADAVLDLEWPESSTTGDA